MSLIKRNQEKRKEGKRFFEKIKKQAQGITLIALVVTVIVLLILAGVAINLTVGDNGLFRRAQNAADTWELAEQNEQGEMDKAADMIGWYSENTAKTVADAIKQNAPYKNNTPIRDELENQIMIPAGFKVSQDSAALVEDGIVIEDKDGNQFVWVPARTEDKGGASIKLSTGETATIVYKRMSFTEENITTDYIETMPSDEEASVNANGGYYIGRCEAGDKESTEKKTMRASGASQTNTITIKKGQTPYNDITQENAKELAEEMDTKQGYTTATTKLASSYAWDTTINFIQIKNNDYGVSSGEGNYNNTTFGFINIRGEEKEKEIDYSALVPTGQTESLSNIYDMGGNLWEYTTERCDDSTYSYVRRGGHCSSNSNEHPAGMRWANSGIADIAYGFRVTLYLKN